MYSQNLGQRLTHSRCSVNIKEERKQAGEGERGGRKKKGEERKKEGKFICGCLTLRIKPLTLKAATKYLQIHRTLWIHSVHNKELLPQLCSKERCQWEQELNFMTSGSMLTVPLTLDKLLYLSKLQFIHYFLLE